MTKTATTIKTKITPRQLWLKINAMPDGPDKSEAAALFLQKYATGKTSNKKKFAPYRYKPAEYISTFLKWLAWTGMDDDHPGQLQVLEHCALVMRQQDEKDAYEKGKLKLEELTVWKPKQTIQNWIRVESGNGIGKTKSASGILNWFIDCFIPSAIFTYAPGGDQARFVMWSEIRSDREGKGLPGRILEKEIKVTAEHFAAHRTVSSGKGKGEERAKGKHAAHQLFILDEADAIDKFIFESIVSMTSGGKSLVIMFANPKSRASMFHRIRTKSYVKTFRISTLFHPNVRAGEEIIPNAVKRDFVERKLEDDCEVIHVHNSSCSTPHKDLIDEDKFDFELPYPVTVAGIDYEIGTIFRPSNRFMTDILGITPPSSADKTLIPVGRYEAAVNRKATNEGDPTKARVGIDAARWGSDTGTMYIRWTDEIWRDLEIEQGDTDAYFNAIKPRLLRLKKLGVTSLHLRIDNAFAHGLIDKLRKDNDLIKAFSDYRVIEVYYGGNPYNKKEYFNIICEMYAEAAESLKVLCIKDAPENLETDLCEREYEWRNKNSNDVKILEAKEDFKKRQGHSPDDGDGFVMACAPDFLFKTVHTVAPRPVIKTSRWRN